MTNLRRPLLLALAVALAVPAAALAFTAKYGVYYQNRAHAQQVLVQVSKSGKSVTQVNAYCTIKTANGSGYDTYAVTKKLGIDRHGRFYFHGTVNNKALVQRFTTTIHGHFTSKNHLNGTVTAKGVVSGTHYTCAKLAFSAKYGGVGG
jgi:hypothetical protein